MRAIPFLIAVVTGGLLLGVLLKSASGQDQEVVKTPAGVTTAASEPSNGELPVLWDVPKFSFTDQNGQTVSNESLRGRVWVCNFIFTRCTTACPIMSTKMILLQRMVNDPEVRFISFSVDPEYDTPQLLNEYADRWNEGERRWLLLSTDAEGLKHTVKEMKIAVKETMSADNRFIHSTHFLLADAEGKVRGVYNSNDEDAMMRLAADTRKLSVTPAANVSHAADHASTDAPTAEAGEQLYNRLGCIACHTNAKIGPHLTGLAGRDVLLSDGKFVKADDAYLRESILEPAAKVVRGYANTMPKFTGYLSDRETENLIAYLKSIGQPGGAAPAAPAAVAQEPAIDPICNMTVVITPDALQAEHAGKTYYFCNPACVDTFKQNPEKYLATGSK